MIMKNCPECGLTITNVQEECPKCHTKIDHNTGDEQPEAEIVQKETKNTKSGKRKKAHAKKTEVEANTTKKTAAINESEKLKEDMIAAVVEAEALAVIEEEKATAEEEHVCETCMAPIDIDQNFCQLCGSSIVDNLEPVTSLNSISDDEINKWIAASCYIIFFIPILFGCHRKSKFVKYHAKQASILFILSTIFFLFLVVFKNIIDGLFIASPMQDVNEMIMITTIDISWRHGTGILFHYYLIGMIYALHLMPFALMISGFIYSIQGKKVPLPLMGRFLNRRKGTK